MAGIRLAAVLEASSTLEQWASETGKQAQACSYTPPFIASQTGGSRKLGWSGRRNWYRENLRDLGDSH